MIESNRARRRRTLKYVDDPVIGARDPIEPLSEESFVLKRSTNVTVNRVGPLAGQAILIKSANTSWRCASRRIDCFHVLLCRCFELKQVNATDNTSNTSETVGALKGLNCSPSKAETTRILSAETLRLYVTVDADMGAVIN